MTLLEQIESAGIVGCGGAGFPTHKKLNCKVEYLIVNAAECEPLLRTDRWLMIHKAKEIVTAAAMAGYMTGAAHIYIALKETYREEAAALTAAIEETGCPVKLFPMRNFYPAGDEQIMVCDVTGRTVPPSGIPLDVGCVISNTATMYAIYEASQGKPLTRKYLTVTGAVKEPCIVHAPLGASFSDCLGLAGGTDLSSYHVLAGGPMMGKLYSMEEAGGLTVTKTTSGFIVLPEDTALIRKKTAPVSLSLKLAKTSCIQCSYCTQMCPRYLTGHPLKPHLIMRKLAFCENPEELLGDRDVQQAMICSECGLCENYACPMGIYPRQVNIYMKGLLRKSGFRYQKPSEPLHELPERAYRRAPSKRIAARLGVDSYYDYEIRLCRELEPETVTVSLSQHIGAPCVPAVVCGQSVSEGDVIGNVPEHSLGARIHASIDGVVESVTDKSVVIRSAKTPARKEETETQPHNSAEGAAAKIAVKTGAPDGAALLAQTGCPEQQSETESGAAEAKGGNV